MNFTIELATPADDAGIRRLLANNPVPGNPPVIYAREPNYFLGCATMGDFWQVVVARHIPTGEIAGVGCRAVRTLYVNGQPQRVGYLGQLRVDKKFRGRWLVTQGYGFFAELHRDGRCRGYLTTIIDGNSMAERLLVTEARPSLPRYRLLDRIVAVTIPTRRSDIPVATVPRPITPVPHRQFFPMYTDEPVDFVGDENGSAALWDQTACKQTIVPDRSELRLGYACFICAPNAAIFDRLLDQLLALAAQRGLEYLVVGLSKRDPLLPVAQRRPHLAYESRLYTVCFPGEEEFHEQLDERIPYVEFATL